MINKQTKLREQNERGAALVVAIFSILLVTVVAFALLSSGLISNDISKNSKDQTSAYYVSEAGLQHAIKLVKAAGATQLTAILRAGDGVANTGDELSTQPAALTPIPLAGLTIGEGYYVVYVSDDIWDGDGDPNTDKNGTIVIRSVGYALNGSTVTTESVLATQTDNLRIGLLADGDIKVTGAGLTVHGEQAIIHVNGYYDTSSDSCAEQLISQTSSTLMTIAKISSGLTCSIPGQTGLNSLISQPRRDIEIHDIANLRAAFRSNADYILRPDGRIYKQGSTLPMTPAEITRYGLTQWSWNPNGMLWTYSSNTAVKTGTYYTEGCDMRVSSGGNLTPVATFISEGSMRYNGPGINPKFRGWAIVSANDVVMHGKLGVRTGPAMVYAYGQIQSTAKTTIYGWLYAANYRRADGTNGPDINDFGNSNPVAGYTMKISSETEIFCPEGWGIPTLYEVSRREVRY